MINLQRKLRQGLITEEDLDESEYAELELIYKKQILQEENKIKNIKSKMKMT